MPFQDYLLVTAIQLAGYSWLEADKLRKAVGKKIPSEMKKQHDNFIEGSVKNGLTREKAEKIWLLFEPFAGYGFGKAHAACYATIAFRTAYLKAHYPVEFMTALLTAESRGTSGPVKNEKIAQGVAECKRIGISVLPPDINTSESEFSIEGKKSIRFGLSAIKNVGEAAIRSILEKRKDGPFKSLEDFCSRIDLSAVNKKTVESLIKAGAMDAFGKRTNLLISYPEITEKAHRLKKQKSEGQTTLFKEPEKIENSSSLTDVSEFSENEKLAFEKEFLGFYLTSHPQMENLLSLKDYVSHGIDILEEEPEGARVTIGGLIDNMRRIFTKKNGNEMAFITISDEKGMAIECVIFPRVFEQYKNYLVRDTVVIISGKIDSKNERPVIIADRISTLSNFSS